MYSYRHVSILYIMDNQILKAYKKVYKNVNKEKSDLLRY